MPIGYDENFNGVIDLIEMKALYFDGSSGEQIRKEEIPDHLKEEAEEHFVSSFYVELYKHSQNYISTYNK